MCSVVVGSHLATGRQAHFVAVPRRLVGVVSCDPGSPSHPFCPAFQTATLPSFLFIPVAAYWMPPAMLGRWPSSFRVTPPWPVDTREVVADVYLWQDVQLTGFLPDRPCAGWGPALGNILPFIHDPSYTFSACQCCWDAVVKSCVCSCMLRAVDCVTEL